MDILPCFISGLNYVKASELHPEGKITVFWRREGKIIALKVDVPNTVHGKIKANKGYKFTNGTTEIDLTSGEYTLTE